MARELPIHNGRLTTDLDADGHRIKNLSGGTETVPWDNVTDKPQTFPPSQHTHAASDVSGLAAVATSGSYSDLTDKPTIPAPVDISGKLDGAAAYLPWMQITEYNIGDVVLYKGRIYRCINEGNQGIPPDGEFGPNVWNEVTIGELLDEKQDALSPAQLDAVNSGATAAKVAAWDGYAAQIAQKANAADLPYAMVTPGEWEFSDGGSHTISGPVSGAGGYCYGLDGGLMASQYFDTEADALVALHLEFTGLTATRPSLPGHLLDRANNLIDAQTGNVTLTLPAYQEGKVRDLLVHVNLGDDGTNPYTVTFAFPTGESGTGFKVKGNASAPIPAPDAAGEWLFSFSESSPHKIAVSLAQLQDATVAGGS